MPKSLINILCSTNDPVEMAAILDALLTESELREIDNRIRIFEMLLAGASQREIAAQLGVGIATVSRGAQAFRHTSEPVLQRLKPEQE